MNQSESTNELFKALVAAQAEISGAKATGSNPHFKSEYSTLADIWLACREALANHGLAVMQVPGAITIESEIGLCIHLTTRLIHESGEWLDRTLAMPIIKRDPQGYGSALTYARRYALASMLGVVTVDDDAQLASNNNKLGTTAKPINKPTSIKVTTTTPESRVAKKVETALDTENGNGKPKQVLMSPVKFRTYMMKELGFGNDKHVLRTMDLLGYKTVPQDSDKRRVLFADMELYRWLRDSAQLDQDEAKSVMDSPNDRAIATERMNEEKAEVTE